MCRQFECTVRSKDTQRRIQRFPQKQNISRCQLHQLINADIGLAEFGEQAYGRIGKCTLEAHTRQRLGGRKLQLAGGSQLGIGQREPTALTEHFGNNLNALVTQWPMRLGNRPICPECLKEPLLQRSDHALDDSVDQS